MADIDEDALATLLKKTVEKIKIAGNYPVEDIAADQEQRIREERLNPKQVDIKVAPGTNRVSVYLVWKESGERIPLPDSD